jgi:hypothetical protein
MQKDIPLLEGERVVWKSRIGGTTGWGTGVQLLFVFGGMQILGMLMMVPIIDNLLVSIAAYLGLAAAAALGVGWLVFRYRPVFYLSDRHLIRRRFLRAPEITPIEKIRDVRRYIARYYTRYGMREITTNRLILSFPDRNDQLFGPVHDVTGLVDLLNYAVLNHHVDLRALPTVDGSPATAEVRTDLFFALVTASGGMAYGPLFIGPSRLIRFTETLPKTMEQQLLTLIAAPTDPPEIELTVQKLSRRSDAGYVLVVDLAETALKLEGGTLFVTLPKRVQEIDLKAQDADRLGKYLASKRKAHPMR